MGLEGIAISGRGALVQALRIEAIIKNLSHAEYGQRVGEQYGVVNGQRAGLGRFGQFDVNGQRVGLGEVGQLDGGNGQRVGMEFEEAARLAGRGDDLDGNGAQPGAVSPILETAEMLKALRALEANLQALRIQDATFERTVNELARPAK